MSFAAYCPFSKSRCQPVPRMPIKLCDLETNRVKFPKPQYTLPDERSLRVKLKLEAKAVLISRGIDLFRHRGVEVVIDTTDTAEFDIADLKLEDDLLESFVRSLKSVPFSKDDLTQGALRARTIQMYDLFFIVGREESEMVVTLGGIQHHESETALRTALKVAEKVGMLRGAAGV